MVIERRKATRKKVKLKIGIASPSGGGKTYSSLLLAHGLCGDWSKIGVIDSENESAALYSHLGEFNHMPLKPPFTPEKYIEAIELSASSGDEVIIIDSASHEWMGEGGALDLHTKLGGKFTDWAKVTPVHRRFIDAILQAPAHVIVTSRTKTEWVVEKNEKGKAEPRKAGLKSEQRDGLEYEFTIAWRIGESNLAFPEKDRTGLFMNKTPVVISEDTGKLLLDWANSGAEPPVEVYNGLPVQKKKLKQIFETLEIPQPKWAEYSKMIEGHSIPMTSLENAVREAAGMAPA